MQVGRLKVTTATKPLQSTMETTWLPGNLNAKTWLLSSAEAELMASVGGNRLALSLYGQLSKMVLEKPPPCVQDTIWAYF